MSKNAKKETKKNSGKKGNKTAKRESEGSKGEMEAPKSRRTWYIGVAAIVSIIVVSSVIILQSPVSTPTSTTMTMYPRNKFTSATLNCTFTVYRRDGTGVTTAQKNLWTVAGFTLNDTFIVNTDTNASATFTWESQYTYWAKGVVSSAGTWREIWMALAPGNNVFAFANESVTLRADGSSDLVGDHTLAGTTRSAWTITLGTYNADNNLTSTEGFGTYWNASDPTETYATAGVVNRGMCFNFTFDAVPQAADVSVFGATSSQVQGNSVIVFLGFSITATTPFSVTFGARVVAGTIAVQSCGIGMGNLAEVTPIVTLT